MAIRTSDVWVWFLVVAISPVGPGLPRMADRSGTNDADTTASEDP